MSDRPANHGGVCGKNSARAAAAVGSGGTTLSVTEQWRGRHNIAIPPTSIAGACAFSVDGDAAASGDRHVSFYADRFEAGQHERHGAHIKPGTGDDAIGATDGSAEPNAITSATTNALSNALSNAEARGLRRGERRSCN